MHLNWGCGGGLFKSLTVNMNTTISGPLALTTTKIASVHIFVCIVRSLFPCFPFLSFSVEVHVISELGLIREVALHGPPLQRAPHYQTTHLYR